MSEELRTLQLSSATSHEHFLESVGTHVYNSPIASRCSTFPLNGRYAVVYPQYQYSSLVAGTGSESSPLTPDDPSYFPGWGESKKLYVATKASQEWMSDSISAWSDSYARATASALSLALESEVLTTINASNTNNITAAGAAGTLPVETDFTDAMGTIAEQAWFDAAWYMHPAFWAKNCLNMDNSVGTGVVAPAGAIGWFKGFPVFPFAAMGTSGSGALVALFGSMSCSMALGLDAPTVTVNDQVYASTDEVLIVTKMSANPIWTVQGSKKSLAGVTTAG